MAILKTERNYVYAYEALDSDCMVQTLIGSGDGGDGAYRVLLTQPISQYESAVAWAVGMADQFEHAIHVVPIDATDYVRLYGDPRPAPGPFSGHD